MLVWVERLSEIISSKVLEQWPASSEDMLFPSGQHREMFLSLRFTLLGLFQRLYSELLVDFREPVLYSGLQLLSVPSQMLVEAMK